MDQYLPPGPLSSEEFTALVNRHQGALVGFLRGLVASDEQALDLAQDVFYDAWLSARRGASPFGRGDAPEAARRWLFRAAYHRGISALRRRRILRWESLEFQYEQAPEAFAVADTFEDALAEREAVREALARLAPQDVACLLLRVVQGFGIAEIGEIVGASTEAIHKRLVRARQRLRHSYLAQEAHPVPQAPSQKEPRSC
ncbi:MAG TPA: sigma-70 family RNA polymerase sigma factor [Ktedonobacterales bacterium]|jgi:RNA polymerase sigma-70 factor (ECF subfamily)